MAPMILMIIFVVSSFTDIPGLSTLISIIQIPFQRLIEVFAIPFYMLFGLFGI